MSHPTHSFNGGTRVGEGNYGTVFTPALRCKPDTRIKLRNVSRNPNQSVGKLTSHKDADLERKISAELATLPNADAYFVLIDEVCIPAPRAEQTETDIERSVILKDRQLTSFEQLIMPFGGSPISLVPVLMKTIDFFPLVQHLLEAGTLLLIKGIVHYDIHRANVLLEHKSQTRLIDFGVAWKPKELTLKTIPPIYTSFDPKITTETPEVSVISGILHSVAVNKAMDIVYQDKSSLILYSQLTGISMTDVQKIFETYINTSICFQKQDWFTFFQIYWSKMDSWSIGVIIMHIYYSLLQDPLFTNSDYHVKNRKTILQVIQYICSPDAGKRYDCAEALEVWNPQSPVLNNKDVQAWLQTHRTIRQELNSILASNPP